MIKLHTFLIRIQNQLQCFLFWKRMNFKEMGDKATANMKFQNAVQAKPDYYDAFMQLALGLLCNG